MIDLGVDCVRENRDLLGHGELRDVRRQVPRVLLGHVTGLGGQVLGRCPRRRRGTQGAGPSTEEADLPLPRAVLERLAIHLRPR